MATFPILKSVDEKHWDFILSIAGIYIALLQLDEEPLSLDVINAARDTAMETAGQWHPKAIEALDDCREFVHRNYTGMRNLPEYKRHPQNAVFDSLGYWMVWNLFGHAPESNEELQLVRPLGGMIVLTFRTWWRDE